MKVGDLVVHPKYGKGNVVKIFWDKDQVICFLANENRYFTKAGAEFMVAAATASMGADFDHSKLTTEESRYIAGRCLRCGKDFKYKKPLAAHEKQCTGKRVKVLPQVMAARQDLVKKRGAQPGNQHARRYKPAEKAPISYAERKGLIEDPVKVYSSSKDQIHKMPEQQDTDTETVSNTGATPQAPAPPTDGRWSTDIKTFATNRLYDYLLAGILLSILLCGIIYAALGVKLLLTN
jgi:hypothetical protein